VHTTAPRIALRSIRATKTAPPPRSPDECPKGRLRGTMPIYAPPPPDFAALHPGYEDRAATA